MMIYVVVFWVMKPCDEWEETNVSEVHAAMKMEAA
jgi:hypothetical protein